MFIYLDTLTIYVYFYPNYTLLMHSLHHFFTLSALDVIHTPC